MVHLLGVITLVLYAASAVLLLFGLHQHESRLKRYGVFASRLGFLGFTIFVLSTLTQERLFETAGDYLLWVGWVTQAGYEIVRLDYPIVRVFVSSVILVIFASSSVLVHHDLVTRSEGDDVVLVVAHVLPALVAEASLLLAAVVSLVFLMQDRRLKLKSVQPLQEPGPSLSWLGTVLRGLIKAGFIAMTLAVVSGALRAVGAGIALFQFADLTVWVAVVVWIFLAVLLHCAVSLRWSLRRVSIVTVAGVFLIVLGSTVGMAITGTMIHTEIVR